MMKSKGFTLIELMITLVIVAILAAIAVPSYREYSIRNSESIAKQNLLNLAPKLKNFRAKNLKGYNNFPTPHIFYVGGAGTAGDHLYKIQLVAEVASWRAYATPSRTGILANGAYSYLLLSSMESCQSKTRQATIAVTQTNCTGLEKWK